jgi:diaminopimelate decarboxylase
MLAYESGHLCVEGRPIAALAEQIATPFFLISRARLEANYQALAAGLGQAAERVTLRYCIKTNNEAGVLELLARLGSHAMASHPAEAALALRCGFGAERIACHFPGLREEELRPLLGRGISLAHAFRLEDLSALEKAAAATGVKGRVSLRLRNDGPSLSPWNFLSRRLGFADAEILTAARRIAGSPWLELQAINFYVGTQQESADSFRHLLRRASILAAQIRAQTGVVVAEINLGGGVPSPSVRRLKLGSLGARLRDDPRAGDAPEVLERYARALSSRFREAVDGARLRPAPALALEPGRSIVGNAAVLVTRVRGVSGSWAFLDASRNHLGESPLLFGRRILPAREVGPGRRRRAYHLSGNTLNTRDVIDVRRKLPPLGEGDLLVFADAGAYTISRASRYAGLSPPVLLLERDGTLRTIRRAEALEDLAGPMSVRSDPPHGDA